MEIVGRAIMRPDRWVVVRDSRGATAIMSSFFGGYLDGDAWRLSSMLKKAERAEVHWEVVSGSGSVYNLHDVAYGLSSYVASVYESRLHQFEILSLNMTPSNI